MNWLKTYKLAKINHSLPGSRFTSAKHSGQLGYLPFNQKFMLRYFYTFIFLCAVALNLACYSSQAERSSVSQTRPTPNIVSNKPKIIAFGDSLTAGFGLSEKESYPYLLQEKLKADGYQYEVINAGVSGDTSAGGLERIEWSLENENVQILILELGGNDFLRGLSAAQMRQNLDAIIKKAKARGVRVLFCSLVPPEAAIDGRQREYGAVFNDLAKNNKVDFMPFFLEGVVADKNLNQADGIHPNAEGAKKITENVYSALKPMLKK